MAYTPYNPYVNPYYNPMASQQMPQQQPPQQMVNVPIAAQSQQPQQNSQGLIWVSGEVGAKSYLVAPSSTVMLMDSESETFYLKSTDSAGMPLPLRIFDYKERVHDMPAIAQNAAQSEQIDLSKQFVTREEYAAICGKYEELQNKIAELQKPKTTVSRKKEVESNE